MSDAPTIGPWVALWTDIPLPGSLAAALASRLLGLRRLRPWDPEPEVHPALLLWDDRQPPPPASLLPRVPRLTWRPDHEPEAVVASVATTLAQTGRATLLRSGFQVSSGPHLQADVGYASGAFLPTLDPGTATPPPRPHATEAHPEGAPAPDDDVWGWLDSHERVLRVNIDPALVLHPTASASASASSSASATPAGATDVTPAGPGAAAVGRLATPPPGLLAGRYSRVGTLGAGGMGEVWAVRDHHLQSVMAMKVVRTDREVTDDLRSRFVAEAQATAQLQHPGIVPVHELGMLENGQIFFTMELVQGQTLTRLLDELHEDSRRLGRWGTAVGFSFRRLLTAMHQATQAVAYAHARGVLHRDLKPDNIMLGDFGEVRVLDWGLARLTGRRASDTGDDDASLPPITAPPRPRTFVGTVSGTPSHMAPEQAWGRTDEIGAATDVYALGATLYHLLSGRPPHTGSAMEALQKARTGRVEPLVPLAPVDPELLAIVQGCLAPKPADRPANAGALAATLGDWLDGAKQRDQAMALVSEADNAVVRGRQLRAEQSDAREESERVRREIDAVYEAGTKCGDMSPAPLALVQAAWAAEDQLAALAREEGGANLAVLQRLQAALHHLPALPEAHIRLAAHHRARHDEAEARGDLAGAAMHEQLVRTHDVAGRHTTWLAREGRLQLSAAVPEATVRIARCAESQRRLVPTPLPAPLDAPQRLPVDLAVPAGSYVLTVEAPGRPHVVVTAAVPREGTWDRTPPEGGAPLPLPLPQSGPDGAVYVPAGWTWIGAPRSSRGNLRSTLDRHRVWVDAFWAEPHPVTNRRYLDFLNARVAQGRADEAAAHVPRYRGAESIPVYGQDANGRYGLVPDADGDLWDPDWPVILVTWADARAFAAWWSEETGHTWRLPTEHEWRAACGGTDGRKFPWGNQAVDHYANTRNGQPGPSLLAPVGQFPTDASPLGVAGGAGGVGHWCRDPFRIGGPPVGPRGRSQPEAPDPDAVRVARGGVWSWSSGDATLDIRHVVAPVFRMEILGFRLVCGGASPAG